MSDDFAEYIPPNPTTTTPIPAITSIKPIAGTNTQHPGNFATPSPANPNSPWYALWERHALSDFVLEGYVLAFLVAVVVSHLWGRRRNRAIADKWLDTHRAVFEREFALVGFDNEARANTLPPGGGGGGDELLDDYGHKAPIKWRENSATEFVLYASGRRNVAFAHVTLRLQRRPNPLQFVAEHVAAFVFDAYPTPQDTVTITLQPFDGNEAAFGVKNPPGEGASSSSKYDGFVWAVVNKECMGRVREERYDLSLTSTKDWDGLPQWTSVMLEAREIGDVVLTREIREAVEKVGQAGGLEYLVVTDQRLEKPTKLEETTPKKRLSLHLSLPSSTPPPAEATQALLQAFLRLPDHLVAAAHFRPEVQRKLRATRDEQAGVLRRAAEEEEKEAREARRAEEKKKERDDKLRGMSADEQRRFL